MPPSYTLYQPGTVFPVDDELTASAPGADFAAFTLRASVGAPLATSTPGATLAAGTPLVIRWTPEDPDARVRLELIADRGHAQVHPSVIECDAPDSAGMIEVPQAMVDAHADPSNWGCGDCFPSWLTRYRTAKATTASGDVELWVGSRTSLYIVP
jgi:hypothetical protein